jgi:prepilin-type N-terminal cleavage/methylation domain-containing protein
MHQRNHRGFTLAEILISITLLAVLAAVVVPTIAGQVKKGDLSKMQNDFLAVRGGVEQFLSDVRKYPKSLGQLTNTVATGAANGPLVGTSFGAAEVGRWRGPYLTKDSIAAAVTGFSMSIKQPFDSMSFAITGAARAAGQVYMTLSVGGIDSLTTLQLDAMMDDGVTNTGSIRWFKGGSDSLRFLLLPIH